ncbi:retrovirus-related pol polyprotein from transposon TNT 1-94 [Tanacetum coccineum]
MDENGIVIKNKARLVAQGYNQQEGIDYEETFALVPRLAAIKIFLAYEAYMGFMMYQMDVKSAFLNGKISKEVYVQQPPWFESSEFPNHVCKLDKALYGLKQAPRACALVKCLMLPPNNLGPDESGVFVNETLFRGMIGSLMYLTASRPDIQFSTCLCARYQANPKESHLVAVKRIFRYLKGTPNLSLCYPKGSGFDLKAYSNSDYTGCNLDKKSTSGGCQILGGKLVSEADSATKSITFTLSHFDKPLSFNLDVFSTVIGFERSENFVLIPPKETVKAGLATLGLTNENDTLLSSSDLINSSLVKISKEIKAVYSVTSMKDYTVTYSNEEMSHHTLYGVKPLLLYAATFKFTRDDLSESALRRNIGDKVLDQNVQEEVKESGLESMGDVTFEQIMDEYDQKNKAAQEVPESPYDTESEIKIIKRFQPSPATDEISLHFFWL